MKNVMHLCLLVTVFTITSAQSVSCPNEEDLQPCSCKIAAFGIYIQCTNFNSSESLQSVFKELRNYDIHTILLHYVCIEETLPKHLFEGLKVTELIIEKSNLVFDEPAFAGLDSTLHVLNVAKQSTIRGDVAFSLAKLTKLNEINVQHNYIYQVRDTWLNQQVPNIQILTLDHNEIGEIQDLAFAELPFLKRISIADNRIREIKRSMFPKPALQLIRLDLTYNNIGKLPSDIFLEMPNLKQVALSYNELKSLPEATWTPVWQQLTQILLIENQLECDNEIDWIKSHKPQQLEGSCVAPKNMAGKSVGSIYKVKVS